MRHQAAAERNPSRRALAVAVAELPHERAPQAPIRSAVASSSSTPHRGVRAELGHQCPQRDAVGAGGVGIRHRGEEGVNRGGEFRSGRGDVEVVDGAHRPLSGVCRR